MRTLKKSKFHSKTKTIYRVNFDEKLDEEHESMHQPPHHANNSIPEEEATLEMEDEILPGYPERKFGNYDNFLDILHVYRSILITKMNCFYRFDVPFEVEPFLLRCQRKV